MSTFLANRKMTPALRARVETSVSGRKGTRRAPARFRALLRLLFVLSVIGTFVGTCAHNRLAGQELERRRGAILDELHAENAKLDDTKRHSVERFETVLHELASSYAGDVDAIDLHAPDALAKPLVWVRGPVESFAVGASIEKSAASSADDTFVRCLLDPPASKKERDVTAKVRAAYAANAPLHDVYRLAEAESALRVLQPAFEDRVRAADERELGRIEKQLAIVRLPEATKALAAPLFLAILDEPGDGKVAADLDGERPHDVRIELYDARASKILFRARKHVDPSAWSAAGRVDFSGGLDSCALALELRNPSTP